MVTPTAPLFTIASTPTKCWSTPTRSPGLATKQSQSALRSSAIMLDESATAEVSLAALWRDLARGLGHIVDGFFSETRCYLLVSFDDKAPRAPIEGRRLEILQMVLGGVRQKNVAMDLDLAPSTIALNSRLGLETLGVVGKPSRAHPLLMVSARAAVERTGLMARLSTLEDTEHRELKIISMPRADRRLASVLPSAELAVIQSLFEGSSYQEIAKQRGTSTRTIANQISAVFRRLRVSGRNELVQQLCGEPQFAEREPPSQTLIPPKLSGPELGGVEARRRSA